LSKGELQKKIDSLIEENQELTEKSLSNTKQLEDELKNLKKSITNESDIRSSQNVEKIKKLEVEILNLTESLKLANEDIQQRHIF
jgi:hypothetical protein